MINLIEQVITLFPTSNIIVGYTSGGSSTGRPLSLTPVGDEGIFNLAGPTGTISDRISLCKIGIITLTGTDSFVNPDDTLKITFAPAPTPEPTGCDAVCEAAVRATLQAFVGTTTTVNVTAGGNFTGQEEVTAVAFGAALLGTKTLVNTCLTENIK
jgi:hypothetical protein